MVITYNFILGSADKLQRWCCSCSREGHHKQAVEGWSQQAHCYNRQTYGRSMCLQSPILASGCETLLTPIPGIIRSRTRWPTLRLPRTR